MPAAAEERPERGVVGEVAMIGKMRRVRYARGRGDMGWRNMGWRMGLHEGVPTSGSVDVTGQGGGKVRIWTMRERKPVWTSQSVRTHAIRVSHMCVSDRPWISSMDMQPTAGMCSGEMWSEMRSKVRTATRMSGKMRPAAARRTGKMGPAASGMTTATSGMPASRPGNTGVSRDAERKTDRANANRNLPHLEIPMDLVAQRKINLMGQRQDRTACSRAAAPF